ncbi:MAG: acetylornithine deacetylase [Planktomarina sp.]|nr:acetylornithine deacetylase [Planktomarina sp.]|tara:strand:- start:2225 stop:3388 length:1164 start_codon:yes stop_codon:yes gene_type:complete
MLEVLTARQLLDQLVAFPTVSSDTNLPLIHFVRDYFAEHGIDSIIIPNIDGAKAGLIAQVGPNVAGGVAVSAHSDVVPVEGQDWSTDPWSVVYKEGRLYGRGTCDMKGFVALAMAALVKAKSMDLLRPLQFALSRDEEVGLLGAPDVANGLLDNFAKVDAVIVGEPTEMQVVTGHKSCDDLQFHVRGHEVHSSRLHEGVSAVMCASRFVEWVRVQNIESQAKNPSGIAALYDPPFTTLHVGKINGGTANNITAKDCYFSIDLRCVGDENPEDWYAKIRVELSIIEAEMQAVHPDSFFHVNIMPGPAVVPEVEGRAEALARRLTGDNGSHTVAYGTDGGHFQNRGFSVVICGPGNIAQAHQPDEFIELSEFTAGEKMLDRLIESLQTD